MMYKILILIVTFFSIQSIYSEANKAVLSARVRIIPVNPYEMKTAKIQPGSAIKFQVEIKNSGNLPSSPGKVFIRFAFTQPMEDLLESRTFQTETLDLPVIYPGQVMMIDFTKEHQLPSLVDFIKQNWNMRHYQAVIQIEGEKNEKVIGYLPLFFSAYYYEGLIHDTPQEVKARQKG